MISYVICMYVASRLAWYVTTDLVEYQTLSYIFPKETPTATVGLMQSQSFASRAVGQILMWNRLLQDLQDISQRVHFFEYEQRAHVCRSFGLLNAFFRIVCAPYIISI